MIFGAGAEIVGVVRKAIELKEERDSLAKVSNRFVPFDEVWCVLDTEQGSNRGIWNRETQTSLDNGLQLAWSNPCIEYWLLLHFECSGSSFAGYAAVREFLRQHINNYKKNIDCFEQLASRIPMAIEHSRQIHRTQWQNTPHPLDCNPGTRVHELAETLIEAAGMTVHEYETRFPLPDTPRKGGTKERSRREGRRGASSRRIDEPEAQMPDLLA